MSDAPTPTALSPSDNRRLCKWHDHLAKRGTAVPDEEDFRSFGSLSSLERLRPVLATAAPEHCGPLMRVISELRREKNRRSAAPSSGRRRGVPCTLSVAEEELPQDWRDTLAEMMDRRRRTLDSGMIDLGDTPPPALSQIKDMTYVLRSIAKVCVDAGRPMAIEAESVCLWLDRQAARGQRATGLSKYLRSLDGYLSYLEPGSALAADVRKEAARQGRIGRQQGKRKHAWLRAHPTDIGKVWMTAEALLAQSRGAAAGTARRYRLALHAAALALSVAAPLRIQDLSRFRIDNEIRRNTDGWSIYIRTQKTGADYERSVLWLELNVFLDELLVLDAPGGDLWLGYARRQGTPLFSGDGGQKPLSADWISDVWYRHVGTGAHIVRTLWHQIAYDSDVDRTWMALALCGQHGQGRTAQEYYDRNQNARTVRAGQTLLAKARKAALDGEED